jgi:hypothetical protein
MIFWVGVQSGAVDVQLLPVIAGGDAESVVVMIPKRGEAIRILRRGADCVAPRALWDWGVVRSYHPTCAQGDQWVMSADQLLTMFDAVEFCGALGYVALHTRYVRPICASHRATLGRGEADKYTLVDSNGTRWTTETLVGKTHQGGDWLALHVVLCTYVAWLLVHTSSRLVCSTILALAGGILPSVQHDARDVFRFVSESLRGTDAHVVDVFFGILYAFAAIGYIVFLTMRQRDDILRALLSPLVVALAVCAIVVSPSHLFAFFFATLVTVLFVVVATRDAANALVSSSRVVVSIAYVACLVYLVWFFRALVFVPAFEILIPLAPIRGVAASATVVIISACILSDVYLAFIRRPK